MPSLRIVSILLGVLCLKCSVMSVHAKAEEEGVWLESPFDGEDAFYEAPPIIVEEDTQNILSVYPGGSVSEEQI